MRPSRILLPALATLLLDAPARAIIRLPLAPLQRWLAANAKGVSRGTCRCEKRGKKPASLHAEGRAVDRHLDVAKSAGRGEAERLVTLLLAPGSLAKPQALAQFEPYPACFTKHGERRKRVDPSVAHRNHIHIGLTRAGAARRTSFWLAAR